MRIMLLASVLLVGCSSQVAFNDVDPQLLPYFLAFEKEAEQRGRYLEGPLSMQFERLPVDVAGRCEGLRYRNGQSERIVTIDPAEWRRMTARQRTSIMYHELGHCLLGRAHSRRGIMSDAVPSDNELTGLGLVDALFKEGR